MADNYKNYDICGPSSILWYFSKIYKDFMVLDYEGLAAGTKENGAEKIVLPCLIKSLSLNLWIY